MVPVPTRRLSRKVYTKQCVELFVTTRSTFCTAFVMRMVRIMFGQPRGYFHAHLSRGLKTPIEEIIKVAHGVVTMAIRTAIRTTNGTLAVIHLQLFQRVAV
jgi:hypothetical protein